MRAVLVLALVGACGDNLPLPHPDCDQWRQWGGNSAHDGTVCVEGQRLDRVIAELVFDPFATDEKHDFGDLTAHYQAPLVAGDAVYMLEKRGTYTPCKIAIVNQMPVPSCFDPDELYRLDTQIWAETRYTWQDGALVAGWTFESDWKPEPGFSFEPMFQPVLVGDAIAVPGAAGAVWLLDAETGEVRRHVQPFGSDPSVHVAGALAVDYGTIYYNALALDHDQPYDAPEHGWLVAIDPDGVRQVDYATLVRGAPAADDLCYGTFDPTKVAGPFPPMPNPDGTPVLPMQFPCGAQVPGINSAPTFAFDGTVYVVSHAQYNGRYSFLTSVAPGSLEANWSTSLRDHLHDGCGVTVPCPLWAPMGVNPMTDLPPAATVDDSSSSSPVVLPDGNVLYGALDDVTIRGHLMELDRAGGFVAAYDFGWDSTPAVTPTATGYTIVLKDNHYRSPDPRVTEGPYFITALDASLQPLWQFESAETRSCTRQPDGTLGCTNDHPHGFEWCINAPAVDRDGTVYANSEDGHLYAIKSNGLLRDRIFLDEAVGAAYTPLSLDAEGRIYALNNGRLFVVGQ